jgi:hypothetical protein
MIVEKNGMTKIEKFAKIEKLITKIYMVNVLHY